MTSANGSLKPCHDCGAQPGSAHLGGCDTAVCLWTGSQRLQCALGLIAECYKALMGAGHEELAEALGHYEGLDDPDHDCGNDVWTGHWPGSDDAARLGLWCRWGPPWIECDPDHPDATEDLNRLVTEARWDRGTQRWERRTTPP